MDTPLLQIEKITGTGSKNAASGIFTSRISLAAGDLASLVSCILVKDSAGQDAQVTARDIFEIATKKLEGAQDGVLDCLLVAKDGAVDYLKARGAVASFVHIIFFRQAAYIVKEGDEVRIFVFRGGKSHEITFGHGSGPVDLGQLYLVATSGFIKSFKPDEFLGGEVNLEEIVDGLATEVSAISDSSGLAAALVLVKGGEVLEKVVEGRKVEEKSEESKDDNESGAKGAQLDGEPRSEVENVDIANYAGEQKEEEQRVKGKGIVLRAKNLFKKIVNALVFEVRKIKSGERLAILRLRRNLVLVVAVILIILVISAGFAIKGKKDRQTAATFNEHLLAASTKLSEGDAILTLNRERARELLIGAGDEVGKALSIKPKDAKALELKAKIDAKLKDSENLSGLSFSALAEVGEPLIAFTTLGKNIVGAGSGDLFIVDSTGKLVDKIAGNSSQKSVFGFNDSVFILADDSVYKVDSSGKKNEEVAEGRSAHDIAVFVGNVYLLSTSAIYKYVPVEGGYVASSDYLQGASFDDKSRMAIDGSVWVTKGNKIFKYLKGVDQNFAISGLSSTNGQFGEIYTTADMDNLYVVDAANEALLAIGKDDGIFKKSYQAKEFGKATGLVVDEQAGKIYISVDNKILVADL